MLEFRPTAIPGALLVASSRQQDERGGFERLFCAELFAAAGVDPAIAQINLSTNRRQYTLRGLHWQSPPAAERKLVRCLRGRLFDVAVDLRPDSPAYLTWLGVELAPDDGLALLIPEGCAHGFLTLVDDTDILYLMGAAHRPDLAAGACWDDPVFGIAWPAAPALISERDRTWPAFVPLARPLTSGRPAL
jgi:dTDP-4-dehydrorhamnose 3,5-epimerase